MYDEWKKKEERKRRERCEKGKEEKKSLKTRVKYNRKYQEGEGGKEEEEAEEMRRGERYTGLQSHS